MRIAFILTIIAIFGSSVFAQSTDVGVLPGRFDPLKKNEHLRLKRVYGSPEMQHSFVSAISANKKIAVYSENFSTGKIPALRRGRLHVWDVTKKAWPREIELDGKSVGEISLSADGKLAVLSGTADSKTKPEGEAFLAIFDTTLGQFRHVTSTKTIGTWIHLAGDGETVFTNNHWELNIQRWNLRTGKRTKVYESADLGPVYGLALMPKADQILAAYKTGKIRIWDADTSKVIREFSSPKECGELLRMALSDDGSRLALGESLEPIRVFNTTSGKEIATFHPKKEDGDFLATLAISDDGKTIVANWENIGKNDDHSRLIAFGVDTRKRRWSHEVSHIRGPAVRVTDGVIQIGGGPNHYDEFDIVSGKHLTTWGAHKSPVNSIIVGPQGFVHSASNEPRVHLWGNQRLENTVAGLPAPITALAASLDKKSWLLACANGFVRHTPPNNGRSIAIDTKHKGTITSVAYNTTSKWIYTASEDRTIKTWSTTDGSAIATLEGHADGVNCLAVSPDDRWLASGASDATIRLWPIKDGKIDADRDVIVLEGHTKAVVCLAFSADGKSLITGSQDRSVKVWDWAKEKCVRTIVGHKNWVTSLLMIDANTVLTTSDDLSACIWNLDTGKEIGQVDFGIVGDCPRCVTRGVDGHLFFGTSNWLIYEMELRQPQSKRERESSK